MYKDQKLCSFHPDGIYEAKEILKDFGINKIKYVQIVRSGRILCNMYFYATQKNTIELRKFFRFASDKSAEFLAWLGFNENEVKRTFFLCKEDNEIIISKEHHT